ncbi:MAG: glycosyltransferase [Acidimicrobiia bacterium]
MSAGGGRRIVVATADTLGPRMAGPAIRALHIARALAAEHRVELVTTGPCELTEPGLEVLHVDEGGLRAALDRCDVFILQGWIMAGRPWIVASDKVLVCDVYDPMHLEQLEQSREAGPEGWRRAVHGAMAALNEQLRRGDFFVCASEKQRDLWLGHLGGLGRINPATYEADGTLRRLIDVVPFGVGDEPPVKGAPAMRGVLPGVDASSRVILWGGGVYNWFDPLSLVRAVDRLRHRHPEVRLVFMGLRHPNPTIPEMRIAGETRALADELGLSGTFVHFNEGWVPFDRRQDFLLEADVGVSTHFDHVETEFSFRTRILDYLWAGLPIVATDGDSFASLLTEAGAGQVVPAEDVDALEAALERLLTDDELARSQAQGSRALGEALRWQRVLEPLLAFCRAPARAPDLLDDLLCELARTDLVVVTSTRSRLRHDWYAFWHILGQEGVRGIAARALKRVRRLADRFSGRARR